MTSTRTYSRAITETTVLFSLGDRVNRVLIRLSNRLSESVEYPSLDELLVLCTVLSPIACIWHSVHNDLVDNFTGGIVLYFWLIIEGELWIRNIIKKALKVILFLLSEHIKGTAIN